MKLLAGYEIDFENDEIIGKDGESRGAFSTFKEFAKENYPDIVRKHLIKSVIDRITEDEIIQHDIVNWVEVIHELEL